MDMDTLIHFVYQVTHHNVPVIILAVLLFFIALVHRKLLAIGILILILAVLNVLFGHQLTNYLVYTYGKNGTALVTGIEKTNRVHNYQPVMEYRVFIHTDNRKKISTTFKSNDVNVYPVPKTEYAYPRPGVPFAIKYVNTYPDIFVIVPQ